MTVRDPSIFGEPDIRLGGLHIWIHTPPGPLKADGGYTWLRSTAHYTADGARVWTGGEIFTIECLASLRAGCSILHADFRAGMTAELPPIEPDLAIRMKVSDRVGHMELEVEMTPDPLRQSHLFRHELDQSYLPTFIDQLDRVIEMRPLVD
ncbi:MAG: hypothetical protein AAGD14_08500 [Planctomycetota bacterium]